jgi:hypothetical protein
LAEFPHAAQSRELWNVIDSGMLGKILNCDPSRAVGEPSAASLEATNQDHVLGGYSSNG